jgi:hypothetical protein
MSIKIIKTAFFSNWLSFTEKQAIMECDFFDLNQEKTEELLGDFSSGRLLVFGEHASGSLLSFYSKNDLKSVDEVPVAWLDSEGAPCIVVSNNLKEFLSILPYGMGLLYTIASVMENNMGDNDLLPKARQRVEKNGNELLTEARERFLNVDILIKWLEQNQIQVNTDPIKVITEAHIQNSELTQWIAENLK